MVAESGSSNRHLAHQKTFGLDASDAISNRIPHHVPEVRVEHLGSSPRFNTRTLGVIWINETDSFVNFPRAELRGQSCSAAIETSDSHTAQPAFLASASQSPWFAKKVQFRGSAESQVDLHKGNSSGQATDRVTSSLPRGMVGSVTYSRRRDMLKENVRSR